MQIRRLTVVAAIVLVAAAPMAATGATRPALRIAADAPLTLRGAGFRPLERIRVDIVMADHHWSRSTRATVAGAFTVRFANVSLNYCAVPLAITARGPKTGTVRAKIPVRECAAP